jgi:hypothetical protein
MTDIYGWALGDVTAFKLESQVQLLMIMDKYLAEGSIQQLTEKPLCAWIGFFPVEVAPCCNHYVHSFHHQFCLGHIQDDSVNFA